MSSVADGARVPLPHRLARWGAKIIGYVAATRRAPSAPPSAGPMGSEDHRLRRPRWRAPSAPPSAGPMGSDDHRLRTGRALVALRLWRPRRSTGCVEALGLGRPKCGGYRT